MKLNLVRVSLLFALVAGLVLPGLAESADYKVLNAGKEGQEIELKDHLVAGKMNIIDFYSEFCPPCKAVAPMLEQLAAKDPDVVVGKVDINRPDTRGIDWNSPVAQQYNLRSIPHFKIYDGEGKLVAEGQEAKDQLLELIKKNEIE
jgi:thioredoxin